MRATRGIMLFGRSIRVCDLDNLSEFSHLVGGALITNDWVAFSMD